MIILAVLYTKAAREWLMLGRRHLHVLMSASVILGLDFSALLLPIVTFLDVFNDIAVVFFSVNLITLTQMLSLAPLVTFDFVLVSRAVPLASRTVTRLRTRIIDESH